MSDLSKRVLLKFCQSWGQPVEEKIATLNEAVAGAGINAKFIQYTEDGKLISGWDGSVEEGEKAARFRKELEFGWCKGSFEAEEAYIDNLIDKYKHF